MIDDRLRVGVHEETVDEAIDDLCERDKGGEGVASRYSDERRHLGCRALRC